MTNQLLIVLMVALGFALASNPATSKIDTGLLKGVTRLCSGIISQFLK
jgi:hypothetical protein